MRGIGPADFGFRTTLRFGLVRLTAIIFSIKIVVHCRRCNQATQPAIRVSHNDVTMHMIPVLLRL